MVVCFVCIGTSKAALVATYDFYNITNNNPTDAAIGEDQISVYVYNGENTVTFNFSNTGPENSAITDIYFDDGLLLGISSIDDSCVGVDFKNGANPSNLPGGENFGFFADEAFSIESAPPPAKNGVDPEEWVSIVYILSGGSVEDVIEELNTGVLRIGIHVQDFDFGGSEAFINNVPEPATLLLLTLGGLILRRSKRNT